MENVQVLNNPQINLVELFDIGNKYLRNELSATEILSTYGSKYYDAVKAYAASIGPDYIEEKLHAYLGDFSDETIRKLNDEGFSKLLASTTISVAALVRQYYNKEIDLNALLSGLGGTGIKDISETLISAYDIDVAAFKEVANKLAAEQALIVSYAAFSEAYKVLMSALNDASLQHEHRLMIEKECEKTIVLIKQYREQLQESITTYFVNHLNTFEHGFAQMDRAILDHDSDGYISGNAEIQKMLGYYAQFNNQKEFDDLMDSDINFKL